MGRDEAALRADLAADRSKLLASRDHRVHPHLDTKILTSWNGLMIAALADGSTVLAEPRYAEAAARASGFVLDKLRGKDGRLLRSHKDKQAKFNAYLDDYANLVDGLTRLFEATGTARWIEAAVDLTKVMIAEFHDVADGGFFYVGTSHEELIRPPEGRLRQRHPVGQRDGRHRPRPPGRPDRPGRLRRPGAIDAPIGPPGDGEGPRPPPARALWRSTSSWPRPVNSP